MDFKFVEILQLAGPVVMFLVGRWSKASAHMGDHDVRIAVLSERLDSMAKQIAVIERDQATQWRAIDRRKDG